MTGFFPVVLLCAVILGVLVVRALIVMRRETERGPRGVTPGKGYTEIDSSYFSGGGGGGHQSSFRVPRDPQVYAKGFVPRQKDKKDDDR